MNYIHQRIKKWWHYMLLGFITIYRILSVGFRINFSLIILLFQASSAQADTVLRFKGQGEVYIWIYLIPWCLGFTYYSLGCFLICVVWGFFFPLSFFLGGGPGGLFFLFVVVVAGFLCVCFCLLILVSVWFGFFVYF